MMEGQNQQTGMNSAERALLALLKKSLFGVGLERELSEEEQLEAMEESRKQAVFCLAAQSASLTGDGADRVRGQSLSAIRQNVEILLQHQYLHELMTKAGIPYVVLKGAASAYYYPQPQQRMMGDVDFLVAQEDVERVAEVLREEGFISGDKSHCHHIGFKRGRLHFELHFDPPGIPTGEIGEVVRTYLQDIIPRAETVQGGLVTFQNPEPFHHGLVMLLHVRNHLLTEGIGLRHLCDWAVFVDRFSDTEFRAMFETGLKKLGLWNFAVTLSLAAHVAVGLPYREYMGKDDELACDLMMDILEGGNFGRKKENRATEGMFISGYSRDGVRHGRIVQMILTVNQIVYTHWPICKKCRILLPFGWLYWGTVRACRVVLGKRKPMHLAKAFRESQPRKELYKRLRLFEKEET